MKEIMKKNYLYLIALLFTTFSFSQSVIFVDDFDTDTPKYTSSGDYEVNSTKYFGTTHTSFADVELEYSDFPFLGARQLDATETITYFNQDVSGKSEVTLAIGIAEDKGPGGTEDWDSGDAVHIEYRLDGAGSWENLFSIVASGTTDSSPKISSSNEYNNEPITSEIGEFDFQITGLSATSLDLRLTFEGLTEAEEDIVFEYIAFVTDIDLFPLITITPLPETNLSNGVGTVDITYTVTGTANSIKILINDDESSAIVGNIAGETIAIPVSDDQSYYVEILAYLDGYNVDDNDVYFEVGTPSLSIGRNEIENFSVYPNPVNIGSFSITTGANSIKTVELFDVIGKMVLSKRVQNKDAIDISALNTGMYILKVKENNKTATRKLIVN